ncbi:SSU ribosomal protein S6p [Dissulfuribacter thermophilus]|uniref:Small ribosomal subunit protein bS6 n=1 Tax=Dissulfuribacter thermophilus TaxID=1156395 RepID=A0A1B9F7A4_9BACT|nr:30S ribosomal protein S6 [Dissulfuribacter thermophilus]OCC15817.1 SSU ribosomal protein S6p [Dissulfuribacter thermophilus]
MENRYYETFYLVHPEKSDEERQDLSEKLQKIITDHGGKVFKVDPWPLRKLAYKVQKQTKGYYVLMEYEAPGDTIQELTRNLRIDERVMKFITVKKEKGWTPEESQSDREN